MFIIFAFVALIGLSVAAVDPSGFDAGHKTAYITDFKYDALNRLQKKFGRDLGENKPWVTFLYNALGQRTSATSYRYDAAGVQTWNYTVSYTYDPLGRMESKGPSEGGFIAYTHDPAGNVTAINGTAYQYDPLNRLAKVTGLAGETTYRYDAVGNLKTVTLPNAVETSYSYDSLNRLTAVNVEYHGTVTTPLPPSITPPPVSPALANVLVSTRLSAASIAWCVTLTTTAIASSKRSTESARAIRR